MLLYLIVYLHFYGYIFVQPAELTKYL